MLTDPPDGWTGEKGFITAQVFKRHLPPSYADHELLHLQSRHDVDTTEKILDELNMPISRYRSEPPVSSRRNDHAPHHSNKLIFATGIIVILMSVHFALCRLSGGGIGR